MNQCTKYNTTCPIARKVRNFNLKLSNFRIREYICFLHLDRFVQTKYKCYDFVHYNDKPSFNSVRINGVHSFCPLNI